MRCEHMDHRASEEKAQLEVGSVKALKPEEEAGFRGTEVLTSIEACMHVARDFRISEAAVQAWQCAFGFGARPKFTRKCVITPRRASSAQPRIA